MARANGRPRPASASPQQHQNLLRRVLQELGEVAQRSQRRRRAPAAQQAGQHVGVVVQRHLRARGAAPLVICMSACLSVGRQPKPAHKQYTQRAELPGLLALHPALSQRP